MKKLLLIIIGTILAAVAVFFIAKASIDDLDGLAGDPWRLVSLEINGKKVPAKEIEDIRVQFTKDSVVWTVLTEKGPRDLEGKFKYDTSKSPKQIDIDQPFAEGLNAGIYDIKGD